MFRCLRHRRGCVRPSALNPKIATSKRVSEVNDDEKPPKNSEILDRSRLTTRVVCYNLTTGVV